MQERPALRRLCATARKWQALSERRRAHFADLYRSGRWRKYYTEEQFLARTREVAAICDRWTHVIETVLTPTIASLLAPKVEAKPASEPPAKAGNRAAA